MRATCSRVEQIEINDYGEIFVDDQVLFPDEMEQLARRDGFANHAEMMQFWEGRLPFEGHIIHWRRDG